MARRKYFSLLSNWTKSKASTRFTGVGGARHQTRPIGARPLRFEPLEDRRLLTIAVDLIAVGDKGRSDNDNVTSSIEQGDLRFAFPAQVGNATMGLWVPGSARAYINGLPFPQILAISSWVNRNWNDVDFFGKDPFAVEGDYEISVTAAYNIIEVSVPPAISFTWFEGTLRVTVDKTAPWGDGNLHPDSDTGVSGADADRITADRTPSFFGVAEANSIVTVAIDGMPAGTTVAAPLDGNGAFQPPNTPNQNVEGNWRIDTNLNLVDGEHSAVFTFEDVAGNRFSTSPLLFFVDTQGPRVTGVQINDVNNTFDLFDPKPSTDGPAPLVDSLIVTLSDLPDRTVNFPTAPSRYDAVFAAIAEDIGHYQVVGDSNGIIPVELVTFTPLNVTAGQPATGYVTINFQEPLPDDRFTLTIADSLVDRAGNALDGESNASQPIEAPQFPSGDGQPGGDFVARFTVDSRPEIGVWSGGSVYVDTNGNFVFDPQGKDNDSTNRDLVYVMGFTTDNIFAGNFAAPGDTADGFDKLAAYGSLNSWDFRWLIDTTNNGVPNSVVPSPNGINGLPVAGNFDGDADNGDEMGVFTGTTWFLYTNDFKLDKQISSSLRGKPIVGDFDGDREVDLATYNESSNRFEFDLADNGYGQKDATIAFGFAGVREDPVAADMNQDGITDIGLFVPDRGGATPRGAGEWYFLVSEGTEVTAGSVAALDHDFSPQPLGTDLFAQFGDEFALPVVGNFDPPVTPVSAEAIEVALFQNPGSPLDVDGDGIIAPLDALLVIDDLNSLGSRPLPATWANAPGAYIDVNGDRFVAPNDALWVIDELNRLSDIAMAIGAAPAPDSPVALAANALLVAPSVAHPNAAAENSLPTLAAVEPAVEATDLVVAPVAPRASTPSTDSEKRSTTASTSSAAEAPLTEPWDLVIAKIAEDVSEAWRAAPIEPA